MKQQRAYLAKSGVAVFEPEGYDPSQHTPSPIFIEELKSVGFLDENWGLRPSFRKKCGKNLAIIETGDADLYGTGEVSGNLRRNGDSQTFWNTENPTGYLYNGKQLYQSHPWVLGVRRDGTAFGVIADTTWKTSLSLKEGIRFSSKGPAFRVVIIEKENPAEVMKTLADLTGKMALPPLWALGNQQCRFSYYPQERAVQIADTLRSHRIPCDVIWLDIHYMDRFKIFTFNPEGFGNPEELNRHLHENGFKAVYMIDPGVKVEKGYFVDDQGVEGDYFVRNRKGAIYHGRVWPGQCHFPDFTVPQVRKWWAGLYRDFLSKGVDGVWNDMNEPSVFVGFGGTMPESNLHRGGDDLPAGPHARYHNIYGQLMIRATLEGVKAARPDKRPFVLSRSNFLGGQRYAAMWTGDNFSDYSQMKESVPMCLNIGLSGQPFSGPDIGGFMRDCTPDLLRHWTASGIYFPFVRNHSAEGTADQEPWAFDTLTEEICRRAIERRYRLLPYIYSLFEEASRSGVPVMRPVFWADFKDTALRAEQQAFLLGGDLLVIPRWCESPSLPKGNWELFSFEDEDDGYQPYLAIRPGAAVPVTEVFQNTVEYNTLNLTVLVNPDSDGRASGSLYEDEGDGYGYREGVFARYSLSAESEEGRLIVSVSKVEGEMPQPLRRIRIGLVRGGKVHFSEWSEGNSVSIEMPEEEPRGTDFSKLKFVSLKNGSISRKYSKIGLIMSNIINYREMIVTMKALLTYVTFALLMLVAGTACRKDDEVVLPSGTDPEEQKEVSYGLPVVEIFTEALQPVTSKETYVSGKITVKDPGKKYSDVQEFKSGMKIKGRGNTTWEDPKKPYRIKLDEKASVLGLNKSKNWCLLAEYEDKSLLRNQTAMEISRICGMAWTPAMISVELYLNNEYLGIYTFCENKEVAKNRVDIDLDKGDVYLELEQFMDNPVCFWTTHRLPVMFSDPEEPSNELKETVIQRFRDFEDVLYSENFSDPDTGYAPMIDVESVINYYIIQELTKNIDGNLRKSTFITLGPDSPLKFYHVWDFDRALGNCYYFPSEYPGTTNDHTGWFIKDQTLEHNEGWYARFFKDPAFVGRLQQKWAEVYPQLRNVPSDFIDVKAKELDNAQQRNFQKWQILGTESYRDKVQKMRDFYMKRLEWLNSEIPNLD